MKKTVKRVDKKISENERLVVSVKGRNKHVDDIIAWMKQESKKHIKAYQDDVDIDIRIMQKLYNKSLLESSKSTDVCNGFFWMCRKCGSWLHPPKEISDCEHPANTIWKHYLDQYADIVVFGIVIEEETNGVLNGYVRKVDYRTMMKELVKNI